MANRGLNKNERRQRFDALLKADELCRQGRAYELPDISKANPIKARLSCKYTRDFFGYTKGTDILITSARQTGERITLTIKIEGDDRNLGGSLWDVMGY